MGSVFQNVKNTILESNLRLLTVHLQGVSMEKEHQQQQKIVGGSVAVSLDADQPRWAHGTDFLQSLRPITVVNTNELELKQVLDHNHNLRVRYHRDPKVLCRPRNGQQAPQEHQERKWHRQYTGIHHMVEYHEHIAQDISVGQQSVHKCNGET